jgi:two-component system response regulator ResD
MQTYKQSGASPIQTILLAEDEQGMCILLRLYLEKLGYHILVAENGLITLDLLARYPVDLVLLDIMMPVMDGFAVCMAIRKFSEMPIIMLTASSDPYLMQRAIELGADGYITKPFELTTVKLRIQSLLQANRSIDLPIEGY